MGQEIHNELVLLLGAGPVAVMGAAFFLALGIGWLKSPAKDGDDGRGCTTMFIIIVVILAFFSFVGLGAGVQP